MDVIRSDDHHADSCWITWNHPNTRLKVTTYPMIHIGDASYYQRIARELERCEYVLHEGVSWRTDGKRHPLYDLAARNLGLAAQEEALQYPSKSKKINLDMRSSEFRSLLFRLPLRYILKLIFLRPFLWVLTLPPSLRKKIVVFGLLRTCRRYNLADDTPWKGLVVTARDRRIVENLERFFQENDVCEETTYSGVLFGASHMPAIYAGLRRLGFRAGTRRWAEVLRVPAGKAGVV